MGKFVYTVQDSKGETSTGSLDAADENIAISTLQSKGYFILALQADKPTQSAAQILLGTSGVGGRDLAFFAEQLATLLNGGVPLVRTLSLLGEHTQNRALKTAIGQITKDVAGGSALYKAMERHPKIFNSMWISLVQAGEMGGRLPKALKQIAGYIEAQEQLKSRIITAMAYPAVLALISMGVLAFFIVKIVPTFAEIFKDFNLKLPALTLLVIGVSNVVIGQLPVIAIGALAVGFTLKGYLQTEQGQVSKAQFLFSIPFFGDFIKNILTERLLTTLSTLIESGVSILNAIAVLEGVFMDNILFQRALRTVKADVATGKSISMAFKKSGVFPGLVTEMMWMGEESGKLPDILATLSNFYREQIDQFIRRFTSIIDPIMVVAIGAVIGVIVISIFMPIFQLSQVGAHG